MRLLAPIIELTISLLITWLPDAIIAFFKTQLSVRTGGRFCAQPGAKVGRKPPVGMHGGANSIVNGDANIMRAAWHDQYVFHTTHVE
jgi:hypothetical protein